MFKKFVILISNNPVRVVAEDTGVRKADITNTTARTHVNML